MNYYRSIILTVLAALLIAIAGCAGSASQQPLPDHRFSANEFDRLRTKRPAFPLPSSSIDRDLFDRYHGFYRLNTDNRTHVIGWVPTSDGYIFLQGWEHNQTSSEPAGNILLLHGYLEHSGNLETVINHLGSTRLNIYAMDLPGHGLSSGERGWIRDFSVYANTLKQVLQHLDSATDAPLILLGHSTGGAAILEYLYTIDQHSSEIDQKPIWPDSIILLAPLVRSTFWTLSRFGAQISEPLPINTIPSSRRAGTENPYYLELADADPLRVQQTSLDWVRALVRWDEKNQTYGSLPIQSLILQGTADRVLDWRYNLEYLEKRLPNADISIIQGGHHNLHQDTSSVIHHILQQISTAVTYESVSAD